jgi:hypothetical protein
MDSRKHHSRAPCAQGYIQKFTKTILRWVARRREIKDSKEGEQAYNNSEESSVSKKMEAELYREYKSLCK